MTRKCFSFGKDAPDHCACGGVFVMVDDAKPATPAPTDAEVREAQPTLLGHVIRKVKNGDVVGLGAARTILAALEPRDLGGLHVVVSAGPTVEDIDPVRCITNRSSGRMGFALAERAAARGARQPRAGPGHRLQERRGRSARIAVRAAHD